MKYRLVFHRLAERDINDIGDFIANDKPKAAAQWVGRKIVRCKSIGEMPERGAPRSNFGRNIRIVPFENSATIFYRVGDGTVTILRVIYAGRDFPDAWPV